MQKEVRKYIVIGIIVLLAIGILFLVNNKFTGNITGQAIYGIASGETTLTLQDADTENLADAEVKGDSANTNYGSEEDLEVKWGTPKRISYITFNLFSIPSNQVIDNSSACLYLYNDQGSQTIGAYHVYKTFNESSITWNTQPCGSNFDDSNSCNLTAEDTIATDTTMSDSWLCWDVSNMVSDEYSNDNSSITIAFYTGDTGNADQFHSKEYTTDTSLRPYLNVTYHSSNAAPVISSVDIIPSYPIPIDDLIGNISASDNEGDDVTYWYSWYKDGSLNATTLIENGLVSYWSFDNDVLDYYASNDGTISGAISTTGKLSGAYNFDGTDDYISIPDDDSLDTDITGAYTVSAWVNMASSADLYDGIVVKGDIASRTYSLYFSNQNKPTGHFKHSSGDADCNSDYSLFSDTWYYTVYTWNGTNQKIYINGDLKNTCDPTGTPVPLAGDGALRIGRHGEVDDYYFNGSIDEVMIYNRALSESEIQQIYQEGIYNDTVSSSYTSEGEEWVLGARVGDAFGWSDETNSSSVSISYNSPPTITLIEPQNQLYSENESLALNFTVSDDNDAIENLTCWYNIDDGSNVTISNCENTTFSVSDSTTHILKIFANDSEGLEGSDSISFTVDSVGVSASITQPSGTKTSRTSIPLQYTATGNNMTCWYNVKTSIGGSVIDNTTLSNCSDTTFSVSNDGDYVVNVFANNTFGNSDSDTSSFTVDTSTSPPSGGGGGGGGSSSTTVDLITEVSDSRISDMLANPGDVKKITWNVRNSGTSFLNDCRLQALSYSSWLVFGGVKDLAAGEEHDFIFTMNVSEDAEVGKYLIGILLTCKEINKSTEFNVEIIEQKLGLEISNVIKNEDNSLNIDYLLKELSGVNQNVNLQFLLFDQNQEKIIEIIDNVFIEPDSENELNIILPIDYSLEGEFKLLININSETYSGVFEESLILGDTTGMSGFTIFGESGSLDNVIALVLIVGFLVFTILVIRHIIKSRKKRKK